MRNTIPRIYLDTSTFIKGFRNEERSELVHNILEKCANGHLTVVISLWTLAESLSALDKAYNKKGLISLPEANSTISRMLGYSYNLNKEGHLDIIVPDGDIITRSWAFISQRHLSADDALHAMCAMIGKSDIMLLADSYFASMLKKEREVLAAEDISEHYSFEVLNLLDDQDYETLKNRIG